MGAVATTAPRPPGTKGERRSLPRRRALRLPEPGRATLEDRVTDLWTQLVDSGTAECPVCSAEITAGRPCESCGSELS
jgi:hypothetical protein